MLAKVRVLIQPHPAPLTGAGSGDRPEERQARPPHMETDDDVLAAAAAVATPRTRAALTLQRWVRRLRTRATWHELVQDLREWDELVRSLQRTRAVMKLQSWIRGVWTVRKWMELVRDAREYDLLIAQLGSAREAREAPAAAGAAAGGEQVASGSTGPKPGQKGPHWAAEADDDLASALALSSEPPLMRVSEGWMFELKPAGAVWRKPRIGMGGAFEESLLGTFEKAVRGIALPNSTVALYADGDLCTDPDDSDELGPSATPRARGRPRTALVTFECGPRRQLLEVTQPDGEHGCDYALRATLPSLCDGEAAGTQKS